MTAPGAAASAAGTRQSVPGFLLLEDGTLFQGRLVGPTAPAVAEVVFTTNMTGYQEVFTDPSFKGQIVVMTATMIGNYGINEADPESVGPQVAGIVVRELSHTYSNWRATGDLPTYLAKHGIPALTEIDTRALTRHLRTVGVMRGVIGAGEAVTPEATAALEACPSMEGLDLATVVSTRTPYIWGPADAATHIVALDFGIKRNILRLFEEQGCRITVVPSDTAPEQILAYKPDGVFLSNGPGDPAAIDYAPATIKALAAQQIPIFGICLGHQLLGLTFGGETYKLPFGHRGGNQPVKELSTGKILITSQNHGFAVKGSELEITGAPDLQPTYINCNDGSVEVLKHRTLPIFAVQYHPEAAPGPHDARPHFAEYLTAVRSRARSS